MAVPPPRLLRSAVLLLCAAAALIGRPEPLTAQDKPRDTLTIGIAQLSATLHPLIVGHIAKRYLLAMTLTPLAIIDKDLKQACPVCAGDRLIAAHNFRAICAECAQPAVATGFRPRAGAASHSAPARCPSALRCWMKSQSLLSLWPAESSFA